MSFFKSSKIIDWLTIYELEKEIVKKLVHNVKNHWSDEIQLISKLVLAKLSNFHKVFIDKAESEDKKFIEKMDISEYKEELWGVHFDLKAD